MLTAKASAQVSPSVKCEDAIEHPGGSSPPGNLTNQQLSSQGLWAEGTVTYSGSHCLICVFSSMCLCRGCGVCLPAA